jgi:hypothetical protein
MQYSDKEIKNSYRIDLLEDGIHKISFLMPIFDIDDDIIMAQFVDHDFREVIKQNPKQRFKVLVDFSALGKENKVTPKARRIYEKLLADQRVEKIAVLSLNMYITIMMNFIVFAARISDKLKIFSDQNQALKWLKAK